jgi:hypothetical protein
MSIFALLRIFYLCCLAVTCYIGWRRGGRSEKVGVLIILTASMVTILVQQSTMFDWRTDRLTLIGVDVIVLLAFFILALRTRRFWPLWATAFHLIAVCSHFVIFLEPHRILQAYALLQGFWAYPIMVSIILGCRSARPALTAYAERRPNPN